MVLWLCTLRTWTSNLRFAKTHKTFLVHPNGISAQQPLLPGISSIPVVRNFWHCWNRSFSPPCKISYLDTSDTRAIWQRDRASVCICRFLNVSLWASVVILPRNILLEYTRMPYHVLTGISSLKDRAELSTYISTGSPTTPPFRSIIHCSLRAIWRRVQAMGEPSNNILGLRAQIVGSHNDSLYPSYLTHLTRPR